MRLWRTSSASFPASASVTRLILSALVDRIVLREQEGAPANRHLRKAAESARRQLRSQSLALARLEVAGVRAALHEFEQVDPRVRLMIGDIQRSST